VNETREGETEEADMRNKRSSRAAGVSLSLLMIVAVCAWSQAPGLPPSGPLQPAPPGIVNGIYHWIHSTGDADRGFSFYHEVFGIELVHSPFGPPATGAPPPKIRPRSEAVQDPLVGDLTDTHGARFRNVFMKLPNAEFGLELSEFNDIPQRTIVPKFWDSGATTLILWVRDIDAIFKAVRRSGASVLTRSSKPVRIGEKERATRSVVVRDPDGYLVQIVQAAPEQIRKSPGPSSVVGAAIGVTVANLEKAKLFYSGILGFDIRPDATFSRDPSVLDLVGLREGEFRRSLAYVPGTAVQVEFYEFRGVPSAQIRWKIQDPGAPQFQFRVRELETLMQATKAVGFGFVSLGGVPIRRPVARFIFTQDPDGVLVEYVHPNPR
jgi:catechol 2,3-dioxygenase-like lactoylglutathione lyase family enzyme